MRKGNERNMENEGENLTKGEEVGKWREGRG